MKRMSDFLLICMVLFSSLAFAKEKGRVIDPESENVVVRGTSEHMRQANDYGYQANAILFGYGPNLGTSAGLQVGKFLDFDSLLLFEYTSADGNNNGLCCGYKAKLTSAGVHYKQFSGNSFYWRGGLDYRTVDVTLDYTDIFGSGFFGTRRFAGNSFALNIQIGNQWQWDNFTLGCDWIGYSMPISSKVTSESSSSGSADDINNMHSDEDYYLKRGSINALRFYIGASF